MEDASGEGSARSRVMAAYLLMAGGFLGSLAFVWLRFVLSRRDTLPRQEAAAAAALAAGSGAAQATDGQVAADPQDGGNSEPWQGIPQGMLALPSTAAQPQWSPTLHGLHGFGQGGVEGSWAPPPPLPVGMHGGGCTEGASGALGSGVRPHEATRGQVPGAPPLASYCPEAKLWRPG